MKTISISFRKWKFGVMCCHSHLHAPKIYIIGKSYDYREWAKFRTCISSLTCTYRRSPVPKSSSYGSTSKSVIPKKPHDQRKEYITQLEIYIQQLHTSSTSSLTTNLSWVAQQLHWCLDDELKPNLRDMIK